MLYTAPAGDPGTLRTAEAVVLPVTRPAGSAFAPSAGLLADFSAARIDAGASLSSQLLVSGCCDDWLNPPYIPGSGESNRSCRALDSRAIKRMEGTP
jgi:hypothetical protein